MANLGPLNLLGYFCWAVLRLWLEFSGCCWVRWLGRDLAFEIADSSSPHSRSVGLMLELLLPSAIQLKTITV